MFYPKSPFVKCHDIESQLFKWNTIQNENFFEWLCKTPKTTTYRVNLLKSNTETVKNEIFNKLKGKYKNAPKIFNINNIPEVVCISNLNNLLEFNDKLSEIIVDINCGAAILRGAHIYAPGVLAMPSGTKINESVNIFADLEGKCKKGTRLYQSESKIWIATGIVKMQRYQLYGEKLNPKGIAIEINDTISTVPSIGDLSSSHLLLQNFPSIVCTRVLNPQPGETILDMCSAPGNKTTHLAELMQDTGTIIALDKTQSKIDLVKQKIRIYELKSIYPFPFDSTKSLDTEKKLDSNWNILNGPPFPSETFDRILLDAPCSALGNRPILFSNMTPKMLKSYPNVQKSLFVNAVGLLKFGGILVYSTCTITEAENEGIVVWAKEKFPNLKLVSAEPIFGGEGLKDSGLNDEESKLVQRFGMENRRNDIDNVGFFIAKFMKI